MVQVESLLQQTVWPAKYIYCLALYQKFADKVAESGDPV